MADAMEEELPPDGIMKVVQSRQQQQPPPKNKTTALIRLARRSRMAKNSLTGSSESSSNGEEEEEYDYKNSNNKIININNTNNKEQVYQSRRHRKHHLRNAMDLKQDSTTKNWSTTEEEEEDNDEEYGVPSLIQENPDPEMERHSDTTTTILQQHDDSFEMKSTMTLADIAMCQALDLEYERAIEDRQVAWTARYQSVRQSTLFSAIFMILLILTGTTFFLRQADSYWTVPEGLLFTIYTITTVGYGHLDMPNTATYQVYTIVFIFVGIAMLTILVAQVYQCIALEASRVASTASQNRRNGMRLWLEARMVEQRAWNNERQQQQQHEQQQQQSPHHNNNNNNNRDANHSQPTSSSSSSSSEPPPLYDYNNHNDQSDWADWVEFILQIWDRMRTFLRENEYGRGLSVLLPFAGLITIGAGVIGPIEGWTVIESIYFAVVSLTTIGFGDYYPTQPASIWFCCLWLPFSVGFMSLYLANVAAFYIRMSDRNVARIERVLRSRLKSAKERAERERRAILKRALRGQDKRSTSSGKSGLKVSESISSSRDVERGVAMTDSIRREGFDTVPTLDENDDQSGGSNSKCETNRNAAGVEKSHQSRNSMRTLFGTEGSISNRREMIFQNSLKHAEFELYQGKSKHHESKISTSMATMKDVISAVHRNNAVDIKSIKKQCDDSDHGSTEFRTADPESEYLSVRSNQTVLHHDQKTPHKKPSFALRALVQERFAEIIAVDIAGYQSKIEIKEYTLAVTIQSLKQTADKWLIPRRARRAFRAVAFEALYFVGEHGLVTRGSDALFALSPYEFHQIFSPLLAAFGDAETMEYWLAHTQALAEVDLVSQEKQESDVSPDDVILVHKRTPTDRSLSAYDDIAMEEVLHTSNMSSREEIPEIA